MVVVINQARMTGNEIKLAEPRPARTNLFQTPRGIRSIAIAVIEHNRVDSDTRPAVIQLTRVMLE